MRLHDGTAGREVEQDEAEECHFLTEDTFRETAITPHVFTRDLWSEGALRTLRFAAHVHHSVGILGQACLEKAAQIRF